jgi:hypothetical protein
MATLPPNLSQRSMARVTLCSWQTAAAAALGEALLATAPPAAAGTAMSDAFRGITMPEIPLHATGLLERFTSRNMASLC